MKAPRKRLQLPVSPSSSLLSPLSLGGLPMLADLMTRKKKTLVFIGIQGDFDHDTPGALLDP